MEKRSRALASLMPKGGYVTSSEGVVMIMPDGINYGYRKPTDSEIVTAETVVDVDMQLEDLDRRLPRNLESAAHIAADTYYAKIKARKEALRASRPNITNQDGERV